MECNSVLKIKNAFFVRRQKTKIFFNQANKTKYFYFNVLFVPLYSNRNSAPKVILERKEILISVFF